MAVTIADSMIAAGKTHKADAPGDYAAKKLLSAGGRALKRHAARDEKGFMKYLRVVRDAINDFEDEQLEGE